MPQEREIKTCRSAAQPVHREQSGKEEKAGCHCSYPDATVHVPMLLFVSYLAQGFLYFPHFVAIAWFSFLPLSLHLSQQHSGFAQHCLSLLHFYLILCQDQWASWSSEGWCPPKTDPLPWQELQYGLEASALHWACSGGTPTSRKREGRAPPWLASTQLPGVCLLWGTILCPRRLKRAFVKSFFLNFHPSSSY